MEWDLNDWKWDGDLFLATPINPLPADCRSGQLFPLLPEDTSPENERGKRELEKRRRDVIVVSDESRSLNLNLAITESAEIEKSEGKIGKKSKIFPAIPIRSVCQVEDCQSDLSHAKDYHRRHKVCDVHSKASKALIGNVMQRFCQQCSRFHVLEEFDEGRRSCRRRLAGHNRRRRKTHPETVANNGGSLNNENGGGSSYLLISLLRILSNMHTNNSEELKDQDVLTHLLRNLANPGGATMPARDLGAPTTVSPRPGGDDGVHDVSASRKKMEKNFDLNNAYDDSEGRNEDFGNQTISNSASTSSQSPSSSSGDAQSRTDRIVFKLFGKDPSNFPLALRKQILDWLSNSPTDIESYIRPGCIILTIYLRLGKSAWDELSSDLSSSLLKLIDASNDSFWKSGWVYTRLQHHVAFVYNGRIVLDTPLPFESRNCGISSIRPIAVPPSRTAQFVVKGFNMSCSTLRLLCAFEGRYLAEENGSNSTEESDGLMKTADEVQSISLSCSIPNMNGRGFIEVEDHGLSSSFFPFIVAEQDVCSEIRTLEAEIESTCTKNQAIEFIHEMGWLLHRFVNTEMDRGANLFPIERFKRLLEFSIDRDWCFVVKKLLGILYKDCVDVGEHSIKAVVSEMSLLHRAVQRNSTPMVVFLLRYVADGQMPEFLFRPDAVGPGGLTPLHVAASRKGNESVLDALTDDPHSVGIEAWNMARDGTGMTPNDYACMRGYYSHVHLVQRKINRLNHHQVTLDIPNNTQMACLNTEKIETKRKDFGRGNCRMCRKTTTTTFGRSTVSSVALYRPAMLSMVAIAAVCVCVALLFKSCPQVMYVFGPFRWELLKYGSS